MFSSFFPLGSTIRHADRNALNPGGIRKSSTWNFIVMGMFGTPPNATTSSPFLIALAARGTPFSSDRPKTR